MGEVIGVIILIIIGLRILGWIGGLFSGGSSTYSPGTPSSSSIPSLAIRVRKSSKRIEGEDFPTFSAEMKGQMPGPFYGSAEVEFFFHLFDTEKTDDGLVACVCSTLDVFQEENSPAFQFRMGPEEISGDKYFPDWVEIAEFPIFCLDFPWKGRRKLKLRFLSILADHTVERAMFEYGGLASGSDSLFGSAETTFFHEVTEPGWLDENKNRPKVWALTIELAMHMAAADGSLDKAEGKAVQSWVKKVIEMAPEGKKQETKRKLNSNVERCYAKASDGDTSLDSICSSLNEVASEPQKYDALKLCIEVMSADGKADKDELKELDRIVARLGLDPDQYRVMLDPHLTTVEIDTSGSVGVDPKALLGIEDGDSVEDIRKKLTAATRKWNSRVTSSDPETVKRAEEMLKMIAELRDDLLG